MNSASHPDDDIFVVAKLYVLAALRIDQPRFDVYRDLSGAELIMVRARTGSRGKGLGKAAFELETLIAWLSRAWRSWSPALEETIRAGAMTRAQFNQMVAAEAAAA